MAAVCAEGLAATQLTAFTKLLVLADARTAALYAPVPSFHVRTYARALALDALALLAIVDADGCAFALRTGLLWDVVDANLLAPALDALASHTPVLTDAVPSTLQAAVTRLVVLAQALPAAFLTQALLLVVRALLERTRLRR